MAQKSNDQNQRAAPPTSQDQDDELEMADDAEDFEDDEDIDDMEDETGAQEDEGEE